MTESTTSSSQEDQTSSFKRNFISAIQFITVLPAGKKFYYEPVGMVDYFPVVGLLLGALLAFFDMVVNSLWPPGAAAVLDVLFLVMVTGAFHLDGLGDAADGLFSHRSREKVLSIMKDSRVGSMGLVAVICGLSLKWAGVSSMPGEGHELSRALMFTAIPALSRGSMLLGFRFMKYGRPEGGTASDLFNKPLPLSSFRWLLVPVALLLGAGVKGILISVFFLVTVALILLFYKRKLGAITGDMLGAMTEITESVLFLMAGMGGF